MSDESDIMHEEAVVNLFGERLGAKLSPKGYYGFDISLILMVITAVISALKNCKPTPPQVKRRGLLMRGRLNHAFGEQFPAMKWKERHDLVEDVFDVADESAETEVTQFVSACCNQAA